MLGQMYMCTNIHMASRRARPRRQPARATAARRRRRRRPAIGAGSRSSPAGARRIRPSASRHGGTTRRRWARWPCAGTRGPGRRLDCRATSCTKLTNKTRPIQTMAASTCSEPHQEGEEAEAVDAGRRPARRPAPPAQGRTPAPRLARGLAMIGCMCPLRAASVDRQQRRPDAAAPRPAARCRCGRRRRCSSPRARCRPRRTRGARSAARHALAAAGAQQQQAERALLGEHRRKGCRRPARRHGSAARHRCRSAGTGSSRGGSCRRSGSRRCRRHRSAPARDSAPTPAII